MGASYWQQSGANSDGAGAGAHYNIEHFPTRSRSLETFFAARAKKIDILTENIASRRTSSSCADQSERQRERSEQVASELIVGGESCG